MEVNGIQVSGRLTQRPEVMQQNRLRKSFASKLDKDLDPKGITVRESCDGVDNPNSNAIIIGLDVTGSMSPVLEAVAKKGLNTLVTNIYDRKPVSDPHIMCMGIGDVEVGDRVPLQMTQFEADIRIAEQLEKLYLEMGGGGNHYESYALAWYAAGMYTKIDCFEKRGKKGYLFTIGDEEPTPYLTSGDIRTVFGSGPQHNLTKRELLDMASRTYEVFHIMIAEGNHFHYHGDTVKKEWTDLLGQRAIVLDDHTRLAEVIVSTIEVMEGRNKVDVAASWDGDTSVVVANAIKDLDLLKAANGGVVVL